MLALSIIFAFMKDIIMTIERVRKEKKLSKSELCLQASISRSMYNKYISGSTIPFNVVVSLLKCLKKQLAIIEELI